MSLAEGLCPSCGHGFELGDRFRRIDGVAYHDPDPVKSCYRNAYAQQRGGDEQRSWLRKAHAYARKLGFDGQDRHAFTLACLPNRGHDAVSWALDAPHPFTPSERATLLSALQGAMIHREMVLANMETQT